MLFVEIDFIVEVPALKVRPVVVAKFQIVPVPVIDHVPDPIVNDLVLILLDPIEVEVMFLLFKLNEPAVNVKMLQVRLSANWKVPPAPLMLILFPVIDLPLEVIVLVPEVALNVKVLPEVSVIADTNVKSPDIFTPLEICKVPVYPEKSKFFVVAGLLIMTVTAPLLASKNTSSDVVGTACPPAPPEVKAHFVPAVASQLSEPPTQYLFAIIFYAEARHLHLLVNGFHLNPTVKGRVVEPFETTGTLIVLFSVFTQAIV